MPEYSYALDEAELTRYDAMAARAFEHEAGLISAAGFIPDIAAHRVDLVEWNAHRLGLHVR